MLRSTSVPVVDTDRGPEQGGYDTIAKNASAASATGAPESLLTVDDGQHHHDQGQQRPRATPSTRPLVGANFSACGTDPVRRRTCSRLTTPHS